MKRIWKAGIATALGLCLAGGAAWAGNLPSPEEEAIREAFVGAENTMYQIGYFESNTGKTNPLTEEQLQSYINDFNAKMDRYYSSDNGCREKYKELNEQYLREYAKDHVDYLVNGGVIDCEIDSVTVSEDGQTATAQVTYVGWIDSIEENEDGKLEVTAPTGQTTAMIRMVKEDGQWKFQGYDGAALHILGGDVIDELEQSAQASADTNMTASLTSEQQEQLNTLAQDSVSEYDSFEEALAAAESISPNDVNPFPLTEELGVDVNQ